MADAKTQLEQICTIYRHQLGQICPIYRHQLGHIFLSLEAISCLTSRVCLGSIGSGAVAALFRWGIYSWLSLLSTARGRVPVL